MPEKKKSTTRGEPSPAEAEPTSTHIPEAGKEPLDDEMLPNKGEPVPQQDTGGDRPDTVGEWGEVDPSGAKPLGDKAEEAEREAIRKGK